MKKLLFLILFAIVTLSQYKANSQGVQVNTPSGTYSVSPTSPFTEATAEFTINQLLSGTYVSPWQINILPTSGTFTVNATSPMTEVTGRVLQAVLVANGANTFNVAAGATGDGVTLYDGIFTSGTNMFSSATAKFTSADVGKTIVLQGSQTARNVLTIASVVSGTSITLSSAASISSASYAYGITTYGTDYTASIKSAIASSGSAGGGVVRFNKGIYIVTGTPSGTATYNSIFPIPYIASGSLNPAPSITIQGVQTPSFAFFNPGQLPSTAGTILYCTNQTVTGDTPAIFSAVQTSGSVPGTYWGAVNTTFVLKDITLREPACPYMTGVQFSLGGSIFVDNVIFDVDVPYSSAANLLTNPFNGQATALYCPTALSGYKSHVGKIYAYGYFNGCAPGDQTLFDDATFDMCLNGVMPTASTNTMQFTKLSCFRCNTSLAASATGQASISIDQLNIEINRGGLSFAPSWTVNGNGVFSIDNFNGSLIGNIRGVYTILAGTGPIQTTVRTSPNGTAGNKLTWFDQFNNSWAGAVVANTVVAASLFIAPTPTLVVNGTPGTTSYSYQLVYQLPDGSALPTPIVSTTTGPATLNSTNSINVNAVNVPGASAVQLFRTASGGTPSSTGKISSGWASSGGVEFIADTGQAGDSTVARNTTGMVTSNGLAIKYGANARLLSGTLVSGSAVIANSTVSGTTHAFPVDESSSLTNVGSLKAVCTTGTITVQSTNVLDTSKFTLMLVEQQ